MLKLERPLVIFDLETTGLSVVTDRIVSVATLKIYPDGEIERKKMLINPTINIPMEATEVHGITNEMVEHSRTFRQIAKGFKDYLTGCDIGGYNSDDFDIPLLITEFQRVNIEFPDWDLHLIDSQKLERILYSQKLEAAYKRHTGKELEDAHDSAVDAEATFEVLQKQLEKLFEKDTTPKEIDEFIQGDKKRYDYAGKTYIKDGVVFWSFGKCKDRPVLEDLGYLNWALNASFPPETLTKLKLLQRNDNSGDFRDETI